MGSRGKKKTKKKRPANQVAKPSVMAVAEPQVNLAPRTRDDLITISASTAEGTEKEIKVPVHVTWSQRRSMQLAFNSDGELVLDVPHTVSGEEIGSFLRKHARWIWNQHEALAQAISLPYLSPEQEFPLRTVLRMEAAHFYSKSFPGWREKPQKIRIGRQKTRWGSCSTIGTISLNVYLMFLPVEIREYVYLHEMCHLRHPHHQADFWADLALLCPDYRNLRKRLKSYRIPA